MKRSINNLNVYKNDCFSQNSSMINNTNDNISDTILLFQ